MGKTIFLNVLFWIGLMAVFATHIGILAMGLPQEFLGGHAVINLVGGTMIVLSKLVK